MSVQWVYSKLQKSFRLCDWPFETKLIIVCDSFFGKLSIFHSLLTDGGDMNNHFEK